jgi:hypothetical protein
LIGPGQVKQNVSSDYLLTIATEVFERGKSAIFKLDNALKLLSTRLPRLSVELTSFSSSGDPKFGTEIDDANKMLDGITALSANDPILAANMLEHQLEPVLERIRGGLKQTEVLQSDLRNQLTAAKTNLEEFSQLQRKCNSYEQECAVSIADFVPFSRVPEQLIRLLEWLPTLQANYSKGHFAAVQKGLVNWRKMAQGFQAVEQKATEAYCSMLEERQELRGRLSVYKTRAARYGVIEDAHLADVALQAEQYLYHPQKTPLPLARSLIEKYASRLKQLTKLRQNS